MLTSRVALAHLILVFACFAWGGAYAVGRFGLNEGSAVWLTLWRWGPGALLFAIFLAVRWGQHGAVIRSNLGRLSMISMLGIVVYPATLFLAVAETTALNASLYLSVTPVLIVLFSSIFWKERIGPIGALAVLFGFFGALVLVFRGNFQALMAFEVAANDLWAIVSALAWAGYCVSVPLKPKQLGELPFLAAIVVIGTAILLVISLVVADPIPLPNTPTVAGSMIYFAVLPSILAFLAWNWGTAKVGPSVAAPYNNLVPFFGGALGILLLGESVEGYQIFGGALIVASLVLNSLRR